MTGAACDAEGCRGAAVGAALMKSTGSETPLVLCKKHLKAARARWGEGCVESSLEEGLVVQSLHALREMEGRDGPV